MTEKVFYQDSYQQTLNTTITAVQADRIEFAATIFYPLGGGQPGDQGTVSCHGSSLNIVDTRKGETADAISHQLESETHELQIGDEVTLKLDWERRHKHMRMHTCMHLLGSLIPVPVTGGSVGAEKSRLDQNPSLVRTMSVQPPRGAGTIRMIRIGDIDYQPCGGTHLSNTSEIGPVRVSKIENKGKRNRRVHLVFED